jgi:RNA polymerase sigma-70 factor (ECF subfamily)
VYIGLKHLSGEMNLTDEHTLLLAKQGDRAAWGQIVDEHQEGVFRFAYLQLGHRQDAEDVAQETFLRAYRSIGRFDPTRPLRPWLLSITANLSKNRWRSVGRYWSAIQRLVATSPQNPDLSGTRAENLSSSPIDWDARALKSAVEKLQEMDRTVIYLRFFLNHSIAETAQTLGIREGTVKSRTHRALERLRQVIERDFPDLREGWSDEAG